ncbi:MAG: hypothetical protein IKH88_17500 [Prevotella sp.]|nr:hypothetical protein [Prevotella sp.]
MEWPKELLEIFEDPLLDGVRPKPKAPTADDRLVTKLEEVTKWVEEHNGELPKKSGGFKEKLLVASLEALRRQANDGLRQYDRLHLLD